MLLQIPPKVQLKTEILTLHKWEMEIIPALETKEYNPKHQRRSNKHCKIGDGALVECSISQNSGNINTTEPFQSRL